MANEQTVKIPVSLEVIDQSVKNIQDVLGKMKPDSASFRQLSKIMDDLVKSSGKIQTSFERGFSSNSEIKAAEKEIRNVEAAMENLQRLGANISFKDIKLDANQQKTFDDLEQKLNIAKKHYSDLLKSFNSKENSEAIKLVDKDLALRSFDEIKEKLISTIDDMTTRTETLQGVFGRLGEQIKKVTESQKNGTYQSGDAIKNIIGEDAYKDFFLNGDKRGLTFKSTKNSGKGGAKEAFINYLKESFTLTEADMADIRKQTSAKDLEKLFQDNNFIEGFSQKINANIDGKADMASKLQAMLTNLISSGSEMSGATAGLEAFKASIMSSANVSPELAQALTLVISKMQELRGNTGSAAQSLTQFDKQTKMINNIKGMADRFLGLYQIIGFIKKGFHEMATTIKELDSVMNGISVVTKMSTSDLWNQVDVYSKMAQQYGTSIKGAYEVSRIYYQQGLETRDVMTLTEETLKLSKISGLDYATTTDYMTTALRGFKMEMTEASKVVDVYSNLAAHTAVSQQELAEAMTRTASSMQSVGSTFEETSAMIATMVAVTRESASNIGSAMKSIASRYGELTKDPKALLDSEGEAMSFNKVDAALKSVGISMQTADHQFRSFTEVILELSDAWNTLDSTQQRYIATQFAGNRQQSRFLALVSNGDLLRQNLQVAENSEDIGTTQALKTLDSIETKINQVTTAWQQFYLNVGLEDAWKGALTGITNILNTLNKMPKAFGKFPIVAIGVVTNAITLIRGLINSAIQSVTQTIVQAAGSTGTEIGTNMGNNMKITFRQAIQDVKDQLNILKNEGINKNNIVIDPSAVSKVATIMSNIASLASMFALSMNDGSRAAELTSGWITAAAGALQLVGGILLTVFGGAAGKTAGIGMIVSSLSSIVAGASLIDETTEEKIARLTKEAEALTNAAKQAKSEEKNLETTIKKYHDLEKSQYESEEAAAEFQEMANEIAQQFPSLITSLDDVGNATIDAAQLDNVLAEARRRSAQATLEAAQAERAKAEAEVEKAQKDVNKERNKLYGSTYNASNTSTFQYSYKNQDAYEALAQAFNIGIVSDENFAIRLGKEALGKYDIESLEEIKQQFDNGAFGGLVQDYLSSYFDSLEYATYQFNKVLEDNQSTPEQIMQASDNYVQVFRAKAAIDDSLWEEGNLWKEVFDQAEQWASSNQLLKQTYNALNEAEYEEIRAAVEKDIANSNMPKALETLGKTSVYSQYKTAKSGLSADMTPDKWYQISGKPVIERLQSLRNTGGVFANWTEEQFDQLDKFLKDTKHYGSTEELKNALSIDFSDLDDDLNNYYKDIADNYRIQAQKMVRAQKKARDPQQTGFLDQLESITDDSSQIVNSSLEQRAINGLLQYEKIIAKTVNNGTLVNIGTVASNFIDELDDLDKGIADQIIENGFITIEGYKESIELLKNSEDFSKNDIAQKTVTRLEELQKLLPANIDLMLQQQIDIAGATIDEAIEYTNKAISGVSSMEDAKKMLDFFNKYRIEDNRLTENDLEAKNGKIKFKDNKSILKALKSSVELELIDTQDTLNKLNAYLGDNFQDVSTFIEDALENNKNEKEFLASLLDATTYAKYFDDSGKQVEGFDKTALEGDIKLAAQNLTEKVKGLNIFSTLFNSLFEAQQTPLWQVIKDIASNPQSISASTRDRLVELKPEWAEKLVNGAYNDYYIAYNDLIEILSDESNGLSRSDRNSLLAQAKEGERKLSKEVTFGEIIKNFDAISTDAIAQWATAREEEFDELIKLFTQQTDGTWHYNGTLQEFINTYSEGDIETEQKALGEALVDKQKTIKDFYSSMVDSITKGEQKIEKTTKNQAIFESLKKAGYDIVEQYGYYIINLSRSQIQNLIAQISEDETLNDSGKTELISSLNNALKTYSFQEIFSDTLTNYASLSYEQANKLVKGMSDELGFETSISKLVEQGVLAYDEFTGTYKANLDKLISLYDTLEQLGIDQNEQASNTIRAQIAQLQHDTDWTTIVENFITSSGSITYTMVGDLINAAIDSGQKELNLNFDNIGQYLTSNGKAFDIKDTDLNNLLSLLGITLDEQTKLIKDAFTQRISNLINSYGNISSQLTGGFSDFNQMQSIVNDLQAAGYDINFEDIFRYSEALHTWVYTQAGVMTRIAQLDEQLKSISEEDSETYKLLSKQRDTLVHQQAQSVDILSVLTASTKTEKDQKQAELLEQVKAYNAVVTDDTKKITAQQLNEIFSGNIQTLKTVYANLNREATFDEIKTVANINFQELLDIESELDAKVGDIVSERAAIILKEAGYTIDDNSQRVTKIDTTQSKKKWLLYQQLLYNKGLTSLENLNQALVENWGEMYNIGDRSQTIINALQNANAMSISDFSTLIGLTDKKLSDTFLSNEVVNGNITRLGGDQIRINNWNNFMQNLFTAYDKTFDTTSEAYISAYSEYLDSQVEQQSRIHEQATSLLSTLESATSGDLINVFELDKIIGGNKIATAAKKAGASFEDGIIKTFTDTNMQELLNNLAKELFDKNLLTSKEYAQILNKTNTKVTSSTAFANIVQNWDNISYEMIETLAESIKLDILDLLKLFESNGRGGYQVSNGYRPQEFAKYLGISLDDYSKQMIANWVNNQSDTIKTIADSLVSSISNGKQRINVTEDNIELIQLLSEKYEQIQTDVNGYFIDFTNTKIEDTLNVLKALGLDDNKLNEYQAQVFSSFKEKNAGNILSQLISGRESLDYNLIVKAIDNVASIQQTMFDYNESANEWSISIDNLKTALEGAKDSLDTKTFNTLTAQIRQTEFESSTGLIQQIFTSSTISEDLMAKFINAIAGKVEQIDLDKIFSYKDGNYQIVDYTAAQELVQQLGLESDQIIANVFKQRIQNFYQNFDTISSQVTSGFSNYSDVKTALEEINKEFSHFGQTLQINLTADDFAVYNDNLRTWVLTQTGLAAQIQKTVSQLRDSGASWSEIEQIERQNLQSFGDQLDFSSVISALDTPDFTKMYQNLRTQIANYNIIINEYNKAARIAGQEQKQLITEADIQKIFDGGTEAVKTLSNIYSEIGRVLTQEEATTAYQGSINQIITAKEAITASVGTVISNAAAKILEAAGYIVAEDLNNGYSVIKSIDLSKQQSAYTTLYQSAIDKGTATQEILNDLLLSSWDAMDAGETKAIDTLGKALGMTYREFGEALIAEGIEVGVDTLEQFIQDGIIEKIGGGKIRITNFKAYAEKLGYDYNSEEYQKAYSEYIDNEIERQTKIRKDITETIDNVLNAKAGDQLNLSAIANEFGPAVLEAIGGNDLVDGILTIHEDSNILQIAAAIAEAAQAKGLLLEADVVELGEKIREAIQSYIDAITQGITGGLKGSQVADIKKFANTYLTKSGQEQFFKETDFVETAKGFQLTSDAAIRYYDALKKAGTYNTDDMFQALQDRILNRDNIQTMTGIVGHIEELGRKIIEANNEAAASEGNKRAAIEGTIGTLERELELYREIAQTTQFNNPEAYDFMGKALPDEFQGAINYWNSLETMVHTFQDSAESGYMGVKDFYNIATELGHLSQITGSDLVFFGKNFGTGAEAAASLIEQGFSALENVDGKGAMINLQGIGANISAGIGSMSDSIDDGIHQMAQSQITMLDGLIAFLETIVAMEKLGSADTDFSGSLEIDELFGDFTGGLAHANETAQGMAAELLAYIGTNKDLLKYCQQVKIGNESLFDIITNISDPTKTFDQATAETYTQILNGLYQASKSNDFSVDNIPTILSQFLVNLDTRVELDDGTVIVYHNGKVYTGDQKTNFSELIRKDTIAQVEKDFEGLKVTGEKGSGSYTMTLKNGLKLQLEVGEDGLITATGPDGEEFTGKTLAEIQSAIISSITQKDSSKTSEQAAIELGFKVATKIEWKEDLDSTIAQFSENTRNVISKELSRNNNANEVVQQMEALWKSDKAQFEAKFGFTLDGIEEKNIHALLEGLVEQQQIKLNIAEIPGTDIHVVGGVPVTLIVKDVEGLENGIPYTVGGSPAQNKEFFEKYLSSPSEEQKSILDAYLSSQFDGSQQTFAEQVNGYQAWALQQAGISQDTIIDRAAQIMAENNDNNTAISALQAIEDAIDALHKENAAKQVSDENIQDSKSTAYTPDKDLIAAAVETQMRANVDNRYGLDQKTYNALVEEAHQKGGKENEQQILKDLVRATLKQQYEQQEKERHDAQVKAEQEEALKNAQVKYDNLQKQTGYDKFKESDAGKQAFEKALQAAGISQIDGTTTAQQYNNFTKSLQAAFDAWSSPENQQKLATEALTGAITTTTTAAESAASGLENLDKGAETLTSTFALVSDFFRALFGIKEKESQTETTTEQSTQTLQQPMVPQQTVTEPRKTAVSVLEEIKDIQSALSIQENRKIQLEETRSRQEKKLNDLYQKQNDQTAMAGTANGAKQVNEVEIAKAEQSYQKTLNNIAEVDSSIGTLQGNLNAAKEALASMPPLTVLETLTSVLSAVSSAASSAVAAVNSTAQSLNNLRSRNITVNVDIKVKTETTGNGSATVTTNTTGATGNVALASGTKTLLGELGPELVVSNGHYFVAGQSGAEFVNLNKDAIVFNHLQTQSLLANGHGGRGKAVTNERNAISMATGNISGPAMAGASAVLAQLRQIRAQWQSILNLSISDLAKKGGGGGGGGGDKNDIPGFIRDVERWYNWLQKIADLEKQITYQEQLRSKIQSDMVSNGKAYFASQKETYEDARQSALTSQSLFLSQKEYFNKRREQLNNSPLSELYTFDETGQPHFKEGSYEWLANIFKEDKYGNIKWTPEQQYKMILARNPQFAEYMKYDKEGKEIKKEDYKKKEDEYYLAMVEAFSERMNSEQEEMQNLFDSWNEQQQAVLEQMQAMNEQLQAMKDNQKELEEAVLDAIVDSRERQIKELEDTRDAIEETNKDFIDGLNKALDKERQIYENSQSNQELQRNRRQLAILQRSGASASQIASLQQKIDQQARDQYFEQQQQQIEAVQEASDLQIERLDKQIELEQEQLEYEKANGLLWGQVYDVMVQSPENIAAFIKANNSDFWDNSPLTDSEEVNDLIFKAEQWQGFRDDINMQNAAMGRIDQNLDIFLGAMEQIYGKQANWDEIKKTSEAKYKEFFGKDNDDPNATAWDAYPGKNDIVETPDSGKDTKTPHVPQGESGKSSSGGGGSGNGIAVAQLSGWKADSQYHWKEDAKGNKVQKGAHIKDKGTSDGYKLHYKCSICGYDMGFIYEGGTQNVKTNITPTTVNLPSSTKGTVTAQIKETSGKEKIPTATNTTTKSAFTFAPAPTTSTADTAKIEMLKKNKKILEYASGGKNDYTGLAVLHGTSTEPEGILNAAEYKAWKDNIKTTNLLFNALNSVSATQAGLVSGSSFVNTETGINIENAVVNMNTTIANDYDARRAGEQALEQMLTIARKSGTRSAQRR